MNIERITFRELRENDLPLMFKWLNRPHVLTWYKESLSQEDVDRKYLPRINGQDPVSCYLIIYNGMPIGHVQSCKMDNYPVDKESLQLPQGCAGIDIFIGEEDYIHRGLGSTIIKNFLKEVVFVKYDVKYCVLDPEPQNEVAIKAYKKAGFKYVKTIWNGKAGVYAYLMNINRDEFALEGVSERDGKVLSQ